MSARMSVIALLAVIAVGLIGAIPFGILGLIFGGPTAAQDIYLLSAVLLGAWLPLKLLIDRQVKGQSNIRLPEISLNNLSLFVLMLGFFVITPFLYFVTFLPFLVGALAYNLAGNNLLIGVLSALTLQVINMVRGAQREQAMGVNNQIFMRVQDFTVNQADITINPDRIQREEPRSDEPEILFLPEDNLRDRAYDDEDEQEDTPMTITLDPESRTGQADDEG